MKLRVLKAALCLAAGLAFCSSHSLADTVENLAQAIKDRFRDGAKYEQGKLGHDWCFNVGTEPAHTRRYYRIVGYDLKAHKIQHPARIQAIYWDSRARIWKYASVFLGLDLGETSYPLFDLNSPPLAQLEPHAAASPKASPAAAGLEEPNGGSKCMSFAQFLHAYVLPFRDLVPEDVATASFDRESEDYAGRRYWIFAGKPHAVLGIARYKVKMKDRDGRDVEGYLVVGFGGGSGP
jgi:hypothetical protein